MKQPDFSVAWDDLLAAFADSKQAITGAAPDSDTLAEGLGYVSRLFAAVLARRFNPAARTIGGLYYSDHFPGGANPDYRMGQALIDPGASYRLAGQKHGAERIAVGLYTPKKNSALDLDAYGTTDALAVGADGSFAFTIGPEGSSKSPSHLTCRPTTGLLIIRELHLRPDSARATIALERLDRKSSAEITGVGYTRAAESAAREFHALLTQFLRWSSVISRQQNVLAPLPDELNLVVRGDPETDYCSGYFDLGPGEGLRVEVPPVSCRYWMIQALNHWLEPIPGAHFNGHTARLDAGGGATFEIGRGDPGLGQWINTRGRSRGAILFRAIGASRPCVPRATLRHLPIDRH